VQRNVEREFGRRVTRLVLPELKVTYLGVRGPWDALSASAVFGSIK